VLITMLHLLHGWSDRDETTGQPQHRSMRQHHSAINRRSSAPIDVVREQHLPVIYYFHIYRHLLVLRHRHLRLYYYVRHHLPVRHLRHSFLWIIGVNTIRITHLDYLHGLLTWISYSTSTPPRT